MNITQAELAAMKARAEAATPAPWKNDHDSISHELSASPWSVDVIGLKENSPQSYHSYQTLVMSEADADFIANARQDIPRLVAELERLQKVVSQLPRTADGVLVVPGMDAYIPNFGGALKTQIRADIFEDETKPFGLFYSTRAAAEQASAPAHGGTK